MCQQEIGTFFSAQHNRQMQWCVAMFVLSGGFVRSQQLGQLSSVSLEHALVQRIGLLVGGHYFRLVLGVAQVNANIFSYCKTKLQLVDAHIYLACTGFVGLPD